MNEVGMNETRDITSAILEGVTDRLIQSNKYQQGRIVERYTITSWLRSNAMGLRWREIADAIEAGEHLK